MFVGRMIESAKLSSGNRRGQILAVGRAARSPPTRDLMPSWSVMPPEQPLLSVRHVLSSDAESRETMVVFPGVGAVLPRIE